MKNIQSLIRTYWQSLLLGFVLVGLVGWWLTTRQAISTPPETMQQVTTVSLATETVGLVAGSSQGGDVGASWPGEIISAGDIEVQPAREGTIVEWKVKIGQRVSQGQVLARLSAPPATPDLIKTLAEQAQSFTRAKAAAEAQATFAQKNKQQLTDLRMQLVANSKLVSDSLSESADSGRSKSIDTLETSLNASKRDVTAKTQSMKDYSAHVIRKIVTLFTNYSADPIITYKTYPNNFYIYLRPGLGTDSGTAQTNFQRDLVEAVKAVINNDDSVGEKTLAMLQSADVLVANSFIIEGSAGTKAVFRDTVADERNELSDKITDITEAKTEVTKIESEIAAKKTEFTLTAANSSKDTAEKLRDIDEKLVDLDRQLALAQAEVDAARVAYATISGALTGGLNITAPRSGIVSTVLKKNGDFVNPGVAVASINSGNEKDRVVRFRVPGNITPPRSGDELTVLRPGFPRDGKKIKVIGIGASLDDNGSFLADADFTETVDWPVHASVRILAANTGSGNLVSLSAVWWDENGQSNVWLVTEDNKIQALKVKTGRTVGDKIEILEGLGQGSMIVSRATLELKTGMQLSQPASPAPQAEPAGDGHGHTHDE